MIVKCEKLFNENTGNYHAGTSDRGLTIGNFYSVLEVIFQKDGMSYRIFDDGSYEFQHPMICRANEFSTVSGKLPSNWKLIRNSHGAKLSPKMWNIFEPWEESFWQDWDNGLPRAKQCFDDELKIIFDCDADLIKVIDEQQNKKPYFKID